MLKAKLVLECVVSIEVSFDVSLEKLLEMYDEVCVTEEGEDNEV